MRGKILDSQYNPGYSSWVIKQTKYGTFDSEIFLDEEDKDIDNSFDGCRIAEFDCDLKAYKERAKWFYQRALGAKTIYNNVMNSLIEIDNKTYIFDDEDARLVCDKFSNEVHHMFKEAEEAHEIYDRMKDYRPIFIENILKNRREIRERTEKKEY